mmetsp:Transcript_17499/g.24912  ORF Transcript_17499/g.24912 Transcript_17499/m.24912 type:complete len:910 (+) Transcript_17499:1233-3962(+)
MKPEKSKFATRRSGMQYAVNATENNGPDSKNQEIKKSNKKPKSASDVSGNAPHEALEVPPLYFLLKQWPCLLRAADFLYRFRWSLTYPLQRRIPLRGKIFRKVHLSSVTYGEILWILPFVAILLFGMLTSFLNPNVFLSGQMARLPLAIAIVTASHNSIVTFLFGMPFERCNFYHKLAGRLTFINGIFHTYVAYVYPYIGIIHGPPSNYTFQGENNFFLFLFANSINISGTTIFLLILAIILTSLPVIRRKVFEVFYFLHILFVMGMVCCAYFHSGKFVVILASVSYGGDLLIRKVLMAYILYPRKAYLKQLTDTVLEISFPKMKNVDYNPGQYIYIAVPHLSFLEWHPFSISSSPHQDVVTLNIRVCGNWTKQLMKLSKTESFIDILFEGPYGSLGVDLISKDRYKMVFFLSGGIGVTPMQSLCHQLMYEHTEGQRELKRIWFLWTARDPLVLERMEVTRRSTEHRESALGLLSRRFSTSSWNAFTNNSANGNATVAGIPGAVVTYPRRNSCSSVVSQLTNDPHQPSNRAGFSSLAFQTESPAMTREAQLHLAFRAMKQSSLRSIMGGTVIRDTDEAYQHRRTSLHDSLHDSDGISASIGPQGNEIASKMLSFSGGIANMLLTEFPTNNKMQDDEWADCFSRADFGEGERSAVDFGAQENYIGGMGEKLKNWFKDLPYVDIGKQSDMNIVPDFPVSDTESEKPQVFKFGEGPMIKTQREGDTIAADVEIGMPDECVVETQSHGSVPSEDSFHSCEDIPMDTNACLCLEKIVENVENVEKISHDSNLTNTKTDAGDGGASTTDTVIAEETGIVGSNNNDEELDEDILRLELFLTGKAQRRDSLTPFLETGRPDFTKTFLAMKQEAKQKGEKRIAVCVCAPSIVVELCKNACIKYSDEAVRFDFHSETFE